MRKSIVYPSNLPLSDPHDRGAKDAVDGCRKRPKTRRERLYFSRAGHPLVTAENVAKGVGAFTGVARRSACFLACRGAPSAHLSRGEAAASCQMVALRRSFLQNVNLLSSFHLLGPCNGRPRELLNDMSACVTPCSGCSVMLEAVSQPPVFVEPIDLSAGLIAEVSHGRGADGP
ncbi:hypothetical protein SKAU_G00066400 [Synaphobranchus kaupii]|uniref:Uncharacterized protein n=1 Tax=Synaphobranchus kaupii TaxID=118154 RepID=A0A9Q1G639_SYNKA|nr:hypothetical protein SKAU_G00066400 [Synaphobranchus kaupii]